MANNDAAFGLRTVGKLGSSPQNGGTTGYKLLTGTTGAIFSGDPVKMVSTGGIAVAAAGDTLLGVFRGVQYTDSSGEVIFSAPEVTFLTNLWSAISLSSAGISCKLYSRTS